jgi:hypothetical protein
MGETNVMTETMASSAEQCGVDVVELSEDEARAAFDERARELLGISGADFIGRWRAGEFDEDQGRPEVAELIHLAPLAG